MRIILHPRRPTSPPLQPLAFSPQPSLPGRHATIAPANLQAVLDSASNAAAKGQAQWHTPPRWAAVLARALPGYRPVIVDLTCGNGQLLTGAAAPGTRHLLGSDIEDMSIASASEISNLKSEIADAPSNLQSAIHNPQFIHADLTLFASYLHQADWKADCFVLNLPFDHHWYRDRLQFLERSGCPAVCAAFSRHDGRTSKDTIDSTIAGLCLALDRCSPYGEGFIIANHSTVERLIFAPGAPHAALSAHIWCRLTIPGNICADTDSLTHPSLTQNSFQTSVLYFARGHTSGPNKVWTASEISDLQSQIQEVAAACAEIGKTRVALRAGPVIRQYEGGHTANTVDLWNAAGLEWRTVNNCNKQGDWKWNVWLGPDGTIQCNLTPFQEASQPVKKQQYIRLNALKDRHPMQLILQRAERKELEHAVFGNTWRVAPAVTDAVRRALEEYNAVRAPLYPLSKVQRLGYLDDNDDILCVHDLRSPDTGTLLFRAGQRYTIRTETLRVKRAGTKMNLEGGLDAVEWEGSELALYIKDADEVEHLFMEERLRASDVCLSIQKKDAPSPIEFNLQDIIHHFEIPEVPDVAAQNPAAYQHNLDLLRQIEEICA